MQICGYHEKKDAEPVFRQGMPLRASRVISPVLLLYQKLVFTAQVHTSDTIFSTVEPLYYGHQGDRDKCPRYRGVRFREVGFTCIWISVSQGPSEPSVIVRCPY